jgi:hypothetical protein
MIYEYEAVDGSGRRIERSVPMRDAPPIGHRIVDGGREYVRVASRLGVATGTPLRGVVNYSLSPRDAVKLGGKVNSDGYVCFESKREQDELVSRSQDTANPVVNVR